MPANSAESEAARVGRGGDRRRVGAGRAGWVVDEFRQRGGGRGSEDAGREPEQEPRGEQRLHVLCRQEQAGADRGGAQGRQQQGAATHAVRRGR